MAWRCFGAAWSPTLNWDFGRESTKQSEVQSPSGK